MGVTVIALIKECAGIATVRKSKAKGKDFDLDAALMAASITEDRPGTPTSAYPAIKFGLLVFICHMYEENAQLKSNSFESRRP